jgi:hypothetical protein
MVGREPGSTVSGDPADLEPGWYASRQPARGCGRLRRSRYPSRFDDRYFRISPIFERNDARMAAAEVRQYLVKIALPRTAAMQILIPPGASRDAAIAEQNLSGNLAPSPVPEPTSLATGVLLVAAGCWCRNRRNRV